MEIVSFLILHICIYIWYGMVWYIWNIYFIYLTKGQEQEQEGSINLMFT